MVDACYSYSDGGSPTVAHLFVDYGADAFVGSIIEVPGDSDDFMYVFWESLCQDDETVSTATTIFVTHMGITGILALNGRY